MNTGDPVFSDGVRKIKSVTPAAARAALAVQGTAEKGAANGYASLGADGKVPSAQLPTISGDPATSIHAAAEKTPPANDDEFTFVDSAASWVLRKIKWSSLVSVFSGLFSSVGHTHTGVYEPADEDIQAHVTGTGSPHTAAGVGADPAGTAVSAVGAHESSYNHALLHNPVTVGEGLSLFGQQVSNDDMGSVAVTGHEADYDHTKLHDPVTVSGNGIALAGQQVSLEIGSGANQIAAGNHLHTGVYDAAGEATGAVADHEAEYDHSKIHDPVTVEGNGLTLFGQQITLHVGAAIDHVASGMHEHPEYAARGDFLSVLTNAEVTINGATTATIGRMHLITDSGTPADYTIALPAVSGNAGKFVCFRVSNAATKHFTIDPNGSEVIWTTRGAVPTRVYVQGETCLLYCDGTQWHLLYETLARYDVNARQSTLQSVNSDTATLIQYQTEDYDFGGCFASSTFTAKAPGLYEVAASVALSALAADKTIWIAIRKNGAASPEWKAMQVISVADYPVVSGVGTVSLNGTTDYVDAVVYHTHGSARDTVPGGSNNYCVISVRRLCREVS